MIFKIPLNFLIRNMANGDKKFLSSHKTFGTFSVQKDIPYIDDGNKYHLFDVISPVLNHENGIVLLYVHGGAYLYGEKEASRVFTSWFANEGFTVIAMNYRLMDGDEVDFKSQVQDVFAALKFIEENHNYLGFKIDKLCLMGDSAGGHLCLATDLVFHSKEAQSAFGIKELPKVAIKCLGLNSTMYDIPPLVKDARKLFTKRSTKRILSKYCFDEEYMKSISPRTYIKNGVKPTVFFNSTSANDYFIDQSLRLKYDIEKYNLDAEFLLETSSKKEIGHVYNHFIFDEEGLKCNNAMKEFFIKHCSIE